MDSNNWRPNPGTEPTIDTSEWRAQLQPDSRQRIVNKIMDTSKKHLPVSGSEGLLELWKIAQRFEEKIFTAATSQSDYLRKISMKMLTMETKSQSSIANNMPSNEGGPSNKPPDQDNSHLMDSNNWRPNPGTEPTIDTSEWRAQLQPDSRQRIVNKIMDTLKKHLPVSGSEGLLELWKIAQRFEEKIFTAATSQSDYLRKISMKMLTMETKSQSSIANNMPSNEGGPSNKPPDQGFVLQSQALNQGQQHPNPLPSQHQPRQQLLSQTIQNNVAPQPNLPSVSSLSQNSGQNINQNSNTQPGQNSAGNTIGHNSNVQSMFSGSQRQMPGRQQVEYKKIAF
ncbi:mediator of RNA polymerase II transcription subunit 15a-like [Cicer arietinum]|uniref:mediator of RNA polymerase II transcription subunit 15a-like n=1 Tax=Cicer arietinum TaxID=3827 RepID=UPI003CC5EC65